MTKRLPVGWVTRGMTYGSFSTKFLLRVMEAYSLAGEDGLDRLAT